MNITPEEESRMIDFNNKKILNYYDDIYKSKKKKFGYVTIGLIAITISMIIYDRIS